MKSFFSYCHLLLNIVSEYFRKKIKANIFLAFFLWKIAMWKGLDFFYVRFWAIFVPNIKNHACTAQGDFSNSFGFRNKYQQEKYKVDIGFPVEVLEITFNPKVKDHLDTSNIKKMRLHFSAHLMDIALMSHLGGDIPLGKAIWIRLAYWCNYASNWCSIHIPVSIFI